MNAPAQTVTLAQTGNSGGYRISATGCNGIVAASVPTGGTSTVTPVAVGSCTLTATGANNTSATIAVTVTSTSISVN